MQRLRRRSKRLGHLERLESRRLLAALNLASYEFSNHTTGTPELFSTDSHAETTAGDISSPLLLGSTSSGDPPRGLALGSAFNETAEPTPAGGQDDYFEFTVSPDSGFAMDVSELSLQIRRSDTDSKNSFSVYYDEDTGVGGNNFATKILTGVVTTLDQFDSFAVDLEGQPEFTNLATPITFRVYVWGTQGTGTMRLDNIRVQSQVSEFFVSSAAEIQELQPILRPGDTLIMSNGTWTDQDIEIAGIGTEEQPIRLRAETAGNVLLNGSSTLKISGEWLVVDGLRFEGGALDSGHIVSFTGSLGDATNSRFTNSAIIDYNPSDINTRYFWVSMYGQNNRVDHNYFHGQDHSGVTVVVWRDSTDPDFHRIDSNHFEDRPEGNGNGFETIRIGTSTHSLSDSFTVVEKNLFERVDGEIEIISVKSGNNILRHNTFRESAGTLTLRHGDDNRVEGNVFLGNGKSGTGGVRVIGERQTIVNNYFAGLDGRADAAIAITAGVPDSPLTGYFQVKDAVIAHNTIVDVNRSAIDFSQGLGSSSRTLLPENVTFANNLIYSTQDPLFEGTVGNIGWIWEGNIAFGQSLGTADGNSGINVVDPQLTLDGQGVWRPDPSSPAIDGSIGDYSQLISDDFEGQLRTGTFDVGADESSPANIIRGPLSGNHVGPSLTLTIADASINEADGVAATTATISRNKDTTDALIITLSSGIVGEVLLPATVTILAGQTTSASFNIDAVNNAVVDLTRIVTITASAAQYENGISTIMVADDDDPTRWVYPGIDSHLIYRPDAEGDRVPDFSDVGYKAGREAIPDVPVAVTVAPVAGDDTGNIQAAIDQVAALPLDANGFRGAVLLQKGDYDIDTQITITASGIVLRGEGRGATDTVLHARGDDQRALIDISGSGSLNLIGSAKSITDFVVPVGARTFHVSDTSGLEVGDSIRITRHGNAQWVQDNGMDLLANPWQPESKNIQFERIITHLDGDAITVDVPLVDSFEQQYGGGTVQEFTFAGRIQNVGVEDLRGESDFDSNTDEDHSWNFVSINRTRDAWVRRTEALYFAYAHVSVGRDAQRVTVSDAINREPKSLVTGGRRYAFNIVGQQNLVTGVESHDGRHDFVFSSVVAGPNVFHNSEAINTNSDSGPHHRWSTGGLFDNIVSDGELDAENRLNSGTGHGWAGVNMVFYNSTGDGFNVHNPPTSQNWVIGSTGAQRAGNFTQSEPQGNFDSHGTPVTPTSLYEAQFAERTAHAELQYRESWLGDIDAFTGNNDSAVDDVFVDPTWLATIPGATSGFDDMQTDRWVPFSFNTGLTAGDQVVGATLALGLQNTGGSSSDDRIYLESLGQSLLFSDLGWTVSGTEDGYVLDLGNDLSLLDDGLLNLAVHGDSAIDWAVLNFQVVPGPLVTYVDASFTGAANDPVTDADAGTSGDQPAVLGVNAFTTIGEAVAATSGSGTIIVNSGTYPEAVTLLGSQRLHVTGPDAAQSVTLDSIAGSAGTVLQLQGSLTLTGAGTSSVGQLQVRSNRATTDTLTIPVGHSLTVAGDLSIGVPNVDGATTNLAVTGGGQLDVLNPSATVKIGLANTSNGSPENHTTVDLSGLGSFTANVDAFQVGYGSRNQSTLLLSNADNSITASTFSVSDSSGSNSRPAIVTLGEGANTIHADNIELGLSKGNGTLAFESQSSGSPGTVTIRGRAGGNSAANILVGNNTNTTTAITTTGTLDLRGHAADVVASTLTIAHRTISGGGGVSGTVSFDAGTFTADSISMAIRSGGDGGGAATLNIGGGNFTVNSGGSFLLASHTGGGAANGTLNVTGGTLTSNVDITDGGGTSTTTINLDGGTLNLTGHNIGGITAIDVFQFQSGTLQNIAQINNGSTGFTKATTGTLTIAGTNTHSAATVVSNGTLLVTGTHTGGDYTISGGVLGGAGTIGSAVAVNATGHLSPGASVGTLSVSDVTLSSGAFFDVEVGGTLAGSEYDRLNTDTAVLGGVLSISLLDSGGATYQPLSTDTFTVLTSSTSLSGTFENVASGQWLETLGGEGTFLVTYGGSGDSVLLSDFEETELDFGDAPASYSTLRADDGARHVPTGPRLGATRDIENEGQPTSPADGDGSDEDGVMFGGIGMNGAMAAVNVLLENASSAKVDAWIDFNRDGDWDDVGENILSDVMVNSAMSTLNYTLPANLSAGDNYARVRLSSAGGLDSTGLAIDGEVEDYVVNIVSPPQVESVVVNQGDAQRSGINTVRVTFDDVVDIDWSTGDVFEFVNSDTNQVAVDDHDNAVVNHSSGKTVVDVTFLPGSSVNAGGGLMDGDYHLRIDSTRVTMQSVELDGDQNGSAGGDYVFGASAADNFYRKYGDYDASGSVGLTDFASFRQTFGETEGQPGYLEGLDADSNGSVGLSDFAEFRQNFGT